MGQVESSPCDPDGNAVVFRDFCLVNTWFSAMDSGTAEDIGLGFGFSLVINCDNQEQVDRIWDGFSAYSEAERCGWLRDRPGVNWQVLPPGNAGGTTEPRQCGKDAANAQDRHQRVRVASTPRGQWFYFQRRSASPWPPPPHRDTPA